MHAASVGRPAARGEEPAPAPGPAAVVEGRAGAEVRAAIECATLRSGGPMTLITPRVRARGRRLGTRWPRSMGVESCDVTMAEEMARSGIRGRREVDGMTRKFFGVICFLALACRGEAPREPATADGRAGRGQAAAPGASRASICPLVPARTEPHGVAGDYQRRRDEVSGTEIWEHRATGARPTGPELTARLDDAQRDRLSAVQGVNGHGIAMCCEPGLQVGYACLLVTAEPAELDAEELARELAAMFARASDLDYEVIVFPEGLGR
ncbi:hypothetical protein [Nannocystis bainbridge]|uniref:Uncharacterized protein n=1 Tax=Nannocystis bainbridge TaxID=2995303 RepID=A0ABT5EAA5_9BACT|nr:hypothetical protein [Nannocystis bainbridge]MDC0722781.1 hypothetical protein [Nannocystis bainbridge]